MLPPMAFWDLEIAFERPELAEAAQELDLWGQWPNFGPSIAAVAYSGNKHITLWYDKVDWLSPANVWSEHFANSFFDSMWDLEEAGYKIFGWNSSGFDWKLLAKVTGCHRRVVTLCQKSYDPCFQVHCMTGYMVGLESAARIIGGQAKEMEGWKAPTAWAAGDYEAVKQYVTGDVVRLKQIVEGIIKNRGLMWRPKAGGARYLHFPHGLLTVEQCLNLPEPDTSWLEEPKKREEVIAWWNE